MIIITKCHNTMAKCTSSKKLSGSGLRSKLINDKKKINLPNWCGKKQKYVCQDLCKTVLANKKKFWINFSPEWMKQQYFTSEMFRGIQYIYLIFLLYINILKLDNGDICFHFYWLHLQKTIIQALRSEDDWSLSGSSQAFQCFQFGEILLYVSIVGSLLCLIYFFIPDERREIRTYIWRHSL